jgi:hypothetical protein
MPEKSRVLVAGTREAPDTIGSALCGQIEQRDGGAAAAAALRDAVTQHMKKARS